MAAASTGKDRFYRRTASLRPSSVSLQISQSGLSGLENHGSAQPCSTQALTVRGLARWPLRSKRGSLPLGRIIGPRMTALSARLSMGFSNIGHFFSHLLMLLYPTVVLALEGRFGLSYGELLSLSIPGYILFGAAALPAGWLGDRWSAEGMMVLYFIGTGAASVLAAFADRPVDLALGLTLIGLFGSI